MSEYLIYSIGMTLLHSVWQIVLIYFGLRMLLLVFRNSSSFLKYSISAGALFTVLLTSLITFSIYLHSEKQGALYISDFLRNTQNSTISILENPEISAPGRSSFVFRTYFPPVIFLYFTGVLFLSARLIASLIFLEKYRTKGISDPDERLLRIFSSMVRKFHTGRKAGIIESVKVKAPVVIGYFRPLVIVPLGFFTQLPLNQIEAILAHELAHIKRDDFLFNIIQSLIELLFFYHPLIYLISRHIREERENCCDDIALLHCRNANQYVRALAQMEGIKSTKSFPAVAFVKHRNSLLNRMRRVLKPRTMKTKLSERILAGFIVVTAFIVVIVTGAATMDHHNEIPVNKLSGRLELINTPPFPSLNDSLIDYDNNHVITYRKKANGEDETIEMLFEEGKITDLRIDGRKIPESEYKNYRTLIDSTYLDVVKASATISEAEIKLEMINTDSLEKEVKRTLKKFDSADREKLQKNLAEAQELLNQIDQEEVRREIQSAFQEAQRELEKSQLEHVHWDSIRTRVNEALGSVDWEEIRSITHEAMDEAEMNNEEVRKAIQEAKQSMAEINWEEIKEAVSQGLASANEELSQIEWSAIRNSLELSLNISGEVLENIAVEMENAFREMEQVNGEDMQGGFQESGEKIKTEKEKLEILERNMEEALEELEQD